MNLAMSTIIGQARCKFNVVNTPKSIEMKLNLDKIKVRITINIS